MCNLTVLQQLKRNTLRNIYRKTKENENKLNKKNAPSKINWPSKEILHVYENECQIRKLDKLAVLRKIYNDANTEKRKEYAKAYRLKNRDKIRAYYREYYKTYNKV